MTALYIILGIILFFVILFSIKLSLIVEMNEANKVMVKYLFFKFTLVDSSKPKKEKKPKKKKKEEKTQEEETEEGKEKQEKGKNSLLKQLYIEQGYDGIEKMLIAIKDSLGSFFFKLYKTLTINEFYLTMIVSGGDAADTAIKYGKLASWLFPALGKVVSTCKTKKYDVDVSPDFLADKDKAVLYLDASVVPIRVTNAAIVLVVQLALKVVLKFLFANNKAKKSVNIKEKTASDESLEETVKK